MSEPKPEVPALLVVDDNDDNRYTLTRRLKRQGYDNVAVAENGAEALEMLARDDFDLVLLDIMMPEVNGYEVLERIKSDPRLRDVPVIMISALDEIESVVKCIELGAEDYLPKPFNPTLLRARVGASLEKKRLRDREVTYLDQLETEKQRSDDLLHAILPAGAVGELKATDAVQPRRYDGVTVLFTDIVDFTAYCDRHPPEQVVAELQALVGRFEEIVEAHGLEKIKTIGDAFLATAGLLQPLDDGVDAAVACGLEMLAAAAAAPPHWQLRLGLHRGPVVAGIVGRRKFLYDLWGDTVNVAARICDEAPPGSLCLAQEVWQEVQGAHDATPLGRVEIKGKGPLDLVAVSRG
jgi:class 3 adenylate cyclase